MNKKFLTNLKENEETARAAVPDSHDRLAAATTTAAARATDLDAAKKAEAIISASFKAQEDTHSALDLAVARAEIDRVRAMLSGAEKDLESARAALRYDDTTLASLIAGVMGDVLPGIEVAATFVDHRDKPRQADLPVCLVVQVDPTVYSENGSVSGDVLVRYHRNPLVHRGLDEDAVEKAAHRRGFRVEALGYVRSDSTGADVLRLRVRSAYDRLPIISTLAEAQLSTFARDLADDIALSLRYDGHSVRKNSLTGLVESSHLVAKPDEVRIVEQTINDHGERRISVESSVLVRVHTKPVGRTFDDVVDEVLDKARKFVPGFGVIDNVERLSTSDLLLDPTKVTVALDRATGMPTEARTFAGFANDNDHQVVIRLVVHSMTGQDIGEGADAA